MKFERPKGFMGSLPRNWIDKNLSRCPFCKTPSLWELAMELKFGFNRYHFRCPNCMAILSIAVAAVDGTTAGLGLTGLLMKKTASKDFRIESVGNNQKSEHLVGAEYPLEILQEWARQIHERQETVTAQEPATASSGKCEYFSSDGRCREFQDWQEGKAIRDKSCSNVVKDSCCYVCDSRGTCDVDCQLLDEE